MNSEQARVNRIIDITTKQWFTDHPVTHMNVVAASVVAVDEIIRKRIYVENKLKTAKNISYVILSILERYQKINHQKSQMLRLELDMREGLFDELAKIIGSVNNRRIFINPRKWTKKRKKKSCPCMG